MNNDTIMINNENTLLKTFDRCHDDKCKENEIKCDSKLGSIDIVLHHEDLSVQPTINKKKIWGIFNIIYRQYPLVNYQLHLEGLIILKEHFNNQSQRELEFNECEFRNNEYYLGFHTGKHILFKLKKGFSGYLRRI